MAKHCAGVPGTPESLPLHPPPPVYRLGRLFWFLGDHAFFMLSEDFQVWERGKELVLFWNSFLLSTDALVKTQAVMF